MLHVSFYGQHYRPDYLGQRWWQIHSSFIFHPLMGHQLSSVPLEMKMWYEVKKTANEIKGKTNKNIPRKSHPRYLKSKHPKAPWGNMPVGQHITNVWVRRKDNLIGARLSLGKTPQISRLQKSLPKLETQMPGRHSSDKKKACKCQHLKATEMNQTKPTNKPTNQTNQQITNQPK